MRKLQPKDLMALVQDVQSTTIWDVDLLNGELFLKLEKEVFHPKQQSERQLIHSQDMDPSVNKMDSFQSLSQKSCKMELMILRLAPQFQRECLQLLCLSFSHRGS